MTPFSLIFVDFSPPTGGGCLISPPSSFSSVFLLLHPQLHPQYTSSIYILNLHPQFTSSIYILNLHPQLYILDFTSSIYPPQYTPIDFVVVSPMTPPSIYARALPPLFLPSGLSPMAISYRFCSISYDATLNIRKSSPPPCSVPACYLLWLSPIDFVVPHPLVEVV